MSEKTEDKVINLKEEEYKNIIASLDELKTVKAELDAMKKNNESSKREETEEEKSVRNKLLAEEEKEKNDAKIVNAVEKETNLREYLFDKANSLGGRSKKIAEEFKENYYNKGFATKKTNSEFLKEFITEIATDKELNKFIPKYKEKEIAQFLAMSENNVDEKEQKLSKARELVDVINSTLEIKGRTEEEVARSKANTTFNNTKEDGQVAYHVAVENFNNNVKNGKNIAW